MWENIRGIEAIRGGTSVNHLMFADDYVIFSKARNEEGKQMQDVLTCYLHVLQAIL